MLPKLKKLSPLYTDYPDVFWMLFDIPEKEQTAATIKAKFPQYSDALCQNLIDVWDGRTREITEK